jgi:hypothetical protein
MINLRRRTILSVIACCCNRSGQELDQPSANP